MPLSFHVKFKSEFIVFILCSTRGRYMNRLNDTDYIVKVVVCSGDFLPCSRKCWWYSFWHAFHFFIRHQATEQSNIHSQINSVAPKACKLKKSCFIVNMLGFRNTYLDTITFGRCILVNSVSILNALPSLLKTV